MTDERWHLRAVALPDGTEPVDWWIAGGRLSAAPVDGAGELPGGWVAPGLVDAHAHLTFEARERLGLRRGSAELVAAHLDLHRRAGVLAVRDAGSLPGIALDPEPEGGGRVVGCGPFLAPPDFFLTHLYEGTPPEEAVDAARARVRAGWPWVKIVADFPGGASFNPLDPRLGYPFAVVAAVADAVHEEGGRLAVHVMGRIVRELVEAGADSIEHGNWADADTVREMAARGTAWCPTLTTVLGHIEPIAEQVPPARALLELQRETLPLAAELGVALLAGTDEEPHGSVAEEVAAMVRYGAPPEAAIAAATTGARRYLGLPGLEDGAPADIVTFDRDPRADVAALAAPTAVVAGGRMVAGGLV
jgi:imidazolonepropionase-like amidohydrolase